ncbi:hypothetical protein FQA47_019128 [Oryzias melastigma]|uniref:Uncharacterized protein n=1 Tax=Oryzias melastigma TaxID=30732 RepID=A0A834FA31_ORYME|nr:hypothetical protein FQA47_019128 [Oryzias melastigma]
MRRSFPCSTPRTSWRDTGRGCLKEEEESTDDQAGPERRKYKQLSDSPERCWMERSRGQLPRSSCEISSSSDTFSSPVHSVSAAGGPGGADGP